MELKSLSQWIREEHIAISLDDLQLLVAGYDSEIGATMVMIDHEPYEKYSNLDWLCIEESLFCMIDDTEPIPAVSKNHYVYLMNVTTICGKDTGVCKVGVSRDPTNRAIQLSNAWKSDGVKFTVVKTTRGSWSRRKTYALEMSIHTVLRHKNLQYRSTNEYDGYTELFYYKDWIAELI